MESAVYLSFPLSVRRFRPRLAARQRRLDMAASVGIHQRDDEYGRQLRACGTGGDFNVCVVFVPIVAKAVYIKRHHIKRVLATELIPQTFLYLGLMCLALFYFKKSHSDNYIVTIR